MTTEIIETRPNRLVLVTGGSGYVGSALVPRLAGTYDVRVAETMNFGNPIADTPNTEFVRCDITDRSSVEQVMDGVTDVIHLAGIVTDELVDMNESLGYRVNVDGARNVAQAARSAGVDRFINMSSSSVYGTVVGDEAVTPQPQTAYAGQKLSAEQEIETALDGHVTTTHIRSATLCGPAPRMRLDTVVNVFSKQAYYDRRITVWGGQQYRSNIHVADVCDLYMLMLEAPAEMINGQRWNAVGSADKVLSIAEQVSNELYGYNAASVEIVVEDNPDNRSYQMKGDKLSRWLGQGARRTLGDAARDNFWFFDGGGVADPNSDIHYNTRRMADVMKGK
jgi:nucleoside-diphosphate-sugar epimerase